MSDPARQNLLFIMADQFRHDWLGCAGTPGVATPNLDRLAADGVRFTQAITNCPVCAPARIALASGLRPHRLGALENNAFLPARIPTYYQRLRDHGYRVGCVGKLDLAKPVSYNGVRGDRPCVFGWGFTHPVECEGKMHAGKHPTPQGPYGFHLQDLGLYDRFHEDYVARAREGWALACHDSVLPTDAFEDVYIGRRSVEWIRDVPDDFPWHLFVSFVGPHDPFDPPTEYADRFRDADVPPAVDDDLSDKPACFRRRTETRNAEVIARTRRQYTASVSVIDDWVGHILDALDERGMRDQTVVVFSSDHGELLGDHGFYTKSLPYEGCLRVPLICAGPGIATGRTSDALVELIDLAPTLTELAGAGAAENLDARSLVPLLHGEADSHREEAFATHRGWRVVRTAAEKLVLHDTGDAELYDLAADPNELQNLAPERPADVRRLGGRVRHHQNEGWWLR